MSRRVLKKIVEAFQKKNGIKVTWTRKGTGDIIRMIGAERLAGVFKCYIVSTGDPTSFMRWKKEGLLMQYITPNTPKFLKGIAFPEGWYTPSRTTYVSMGYSTKRVKESEWPRVGKMSWTPSGRAVSPSSTRAKAVRRDSGWVSSSVNSAGAILKSSPETSPWCSSRPPPPPSP